MERRERSLAGAIAGAVPDRWRPGL